MICIEGIDLDPASRCRHWHAAHDIVAIRFPCCDRWFSCYECHEALTDHTAERWPRELFHVEAIYCGNCQRLFMIKEYLDARSVCPSCRAQWNPNCARHRSRYFAD